MKRSRRRGEEHPGRSAASGVRDPDRLNGTALPYHDPRFGHYEVWYITVADPKTRRGAWIRYTLDVPTESNRNDTAQAGLWCTLFDPDLSETVQHKAYVPLHQFEFESDPFRIRVGSSRMTSDGCRGKIEPEVGGSLEWDLSWQPTDPQADGFLHYPRALYTGGFPRTKVLSPRLDVLVSGEIRIGERVVRFDRAPGGQTHLWGTRHAFRWAWGHVNHFTSGGKGIFEGLTGQVAMGPLRSPPLTALSLVVEGRRYAFNRWASVLRNRGWPGPLPSWSFQARSWTHRLEGTFEVAPENLVLVEYRDPDGRRLHCANTEVGSARLVLSRRTRVGWDRVAALVADGTAGLEFGGDGVRRAFETLR